MGVSSTGAVVVECACKCYPEMHGVVTFKSNSLSILITISYLQQKYFVTVIYILAT